MTANVMPLCEKTRKLELIWVHSANGISEDLQFPDCDLAAGQNGPETDLIQIYKLGSQIRLGDPCRCSMRIGEKMFATLKESKRNNQFFFSSTLKYTQGRFIPASPTSFQVQLKQPFVALHLLNLTPPFNFRNIASMGGVLPCQMLSGLSYFKNKDKARS